MKMQLLLGTGNRRRKLMGVEGDTEWSALTTLDVDPDCRPDVLHDLNVRPLPFADDTFEELHAYEVLEHVGRQGDWRGFFEEFSEYHRILTPGGLLFATVPSIKSRWAWGDPGHTRVIQPESLIFLSRAHYAAGVGYGPMTDYRAFYKADFELCEGFEDDESFRFILRAIK